jgi:hypothetical protein
MCVVDRADYTSASAEKGYLLAARYMSPELLSRFEPSSAPSKNCLTLRLRSSWMLD